MNRTQLTSLAVALACFGAVGVSATTLSSSVSADPSDALDPDYQAIPIAGDGLSQLESAVTNGGPEQSSGGSGRQRDGPGSSGPRDQRAAGDGDETTDASSVGQGEGNGAGGDAGGANGNGEGNGGGEGPGLTASGSGFSLADLLALLVLLALLGATAWLWYRYRDRFRELFATAEEAADDDPRPIPDGPPTDDNLVFETWDALVSDLDVDDDHALTTRECADRATAAGFDRDQIERLRLDFEDVRYGGQPVTDTRRRRARTARKRLELNGESP